MSAESWFYIKEEIQMRKIVSLLLAVVLTIGMTATAFAANPKITKQVAALADVDAGEVVPGAKIFIPLEKGAFEGATDVLTASDVRTSKITVKHTVKAGPKAIESVEVKENSKKEAGVLITMVDPFTSTKPLDFELTFYLYINGKRQNLGTAVYGTLSNEEELVYSDTDYVDLSGGVVAKCEETASKVEAYLGNDISMFVKMLRGKTYVGAASVDLTDDDVKMFNQYNEIVGVYNLSTTGFDSVTGKIVKIDSSETLYVYDGDFNYLGKTSEMLPYSTKYYTSSAKLDVVEAGGFEDEEDYDFNDDTDSELPDDVEPEVSVAQGKQPAVAATKQPARDANPDTGVSPVLGLAVFAGMASLGALTVISFKKKQ